MVTYSFTPEELDMVVEALNARASRRESEARYYLRRESAEKAKTLRKFVEKLRVYARNP